MRVDTTQHHRVVWTNLLLTTLLNSSQEACQSIHKCHNKTQATFHLLHSLLQVTHTKLQYLLHQCHPLLHLAPTSSTRHHNYHLTLLTYLLMELQLQERMMTLTMTI